MATAIDPLSYKGAWIPNAYPNPVEKFTASQVNNITNNSNFLAAQYQTAFSGQWFFGALGNTFVCAPSCYVTLGVGTHYYEYCIYASTVDNESCGTLYIDGTTMCEYQNEDGNYTLESGVGTFITSSTRDILFSYGDIAYEGSSLITIWVGLRRHYE